MGFYKNVSHFVAFIGLKQKQFLLESFFYKAYGFVQLMSLFK